MTWYQVEGEIDLFFCTFFNSLFAINVLFSIPLEPVDSESDHWSM